MRRDYLSGVAAVLIGLAAIAAAPAGRPPADPGDAPVARVKATPAPVAPVPVAARKADRVRCIGVDRVAGAVVFGDRAVELSMKDGSRWRMGFAEECPALSFYQGFYYRRAVAGRLCAGRDAVISRAGGECPIGAITLVRKAKVVRRRR